MENEKTHLKEHGSEVGSETNSHTKSKLQKNHKIILGIIAVLAIIIAGGLIWIYTGSISSAKEKVLKAIPLPAAIVDMKFVPAKTIIERIALSKQLLEEQGLGDQADSTKTFDQVIDTKKLQAVAGQHNVKATTTDIDEEYKNIVNQYGGGDENAFKEELNKVYHMSPEKFKDEVIRQQVLQSNLLLWYTQQEDLNKKAYETARDLQNKLNSGQSFDDVARVYTQDEATKEFAGDSGILPYDDLLPEFRDQLAESKVDDTKLIASRYGLHLIKVLELNNDGANGAKQIHLQQVFVQQEGFPEWLTSQVDNIRVIKLLQFS